MISEENGVTAKLKRSQCNNNTIINHCLSHRLNLGAKDLWNKDKTLLNFNNTIHEICRLFSKSSNG